eukprot:6212850-Pleurochrysis_carterae.AAC.4
MHRRVQSHAKPPLSGTVLPLHAAAESASWAIEKHAAGESKAAQLTCCQGANEGISLASALTTGRHSIAIT